MEIKAGKPYFCAIRLKSGKYAGVEKKPGYVIKYQITLRQEGRQMPEIRELIREGKGKRVYATEDPDLAVVYYKDEARAYHGLKRGRILGKGEINNAICQHLFISR